MHEFIATFDTIFHKYSQFDYKNTYMSKQELLQFLCDFRLIEEFGATQKFRFEYETNEDTQGQTFAPISQAQVNLLITKHAQSNGMFSFETFIIFLRDLANLSLFRDETRSEPGGLSP